MNRRPFRYAWCLLAIPVIAVGFFLRNASADGPEDFKGKAALNISLTTVTGEHMNLADLKGKVVVIDFWATWCPPCRASLPHIQKLSTDQDAAKNGLKVFAVNAKETKDKIEPFLKQNNYTFVVPMDSDGQAMDAYKVDGIPTTVVIGRDGKVRAVTVGWDGSGKAVDDAVDAALKEAVN